MQTPTPTIALCPGCDEHRPVKPYRARFNGGAFEPVDYCDECADLAYANWSGTVDTIEPRPEA